MAKAADLLRAVEFYRLQQHPELLVQKLSDEQLKTGIRAVAEIFKVLKDEAITRNLWTELTKRA